MGIFRRRIRPADGEPDREEAARRAFERGTALFKQRRWSDAVAAFRTAVGLAPNSVNAQFFLGASLSQAGDAEAALAPLRKCLELDPNHIDGNNALGMTLGRLNRHDEAETFEAKAAFLVHPQAPETLRTIKMGYCRKCAAPIERVDPTTASIRVYGPRVGMECEACPTVLCSRCVLGKAESAVAPSCPDCGGTLIGFRVTSEL